MSTDDSQSGSPDRETVRIDGFSIRDGVVSVDSYVVRIHDINGMVCQRRNFSLLEGGIAGVVAGALIVLSFIFGIGLAYLAVIPLLYCIFDVWAVVKSSPYGVLTIHLKGGEVLKVKRGVVVSPWSKYDPSTHTDQIEDMHRRISRAMEQQKA